MYRESLRAQPGQEESTTSTGRRQPGRRGFSPVCSRYSGVYCQDVSVRSVSLLGILSLPGYFARCPIRRDHLSVCGLTGAGPTGVWHHQVLPLCCLPPTNLSRSGRPIRSRLPRWDYVLRGVKRLQGSRQTRTRLPITPDILRAWHRHWSPRASQFDIVMLWAACITWILRFLAGGGLHSRHDRVP